MSRCSLSPPVYAAVVTSTTSMTRSLPIMSCKRNWTFLGSDNGDRTAAILTSITTTCKRLCVDLFEYLRDVFQPISIYPQNNIGNLLPDKWKAAYQLTIN